MSTGKGSRSTNALKHGAYSREVLLPHEDRRAYDRLVSEIRSEWNPEGPTEETLVDRLVALIWRQRRIARYEQAELEESIESIRSFNEQVELRVALKRLAPEFAQAQTAEQVEKLLEKYNQYSSIIVSAVPRPAASDTGWGAAILGYLSKLKTDTIEGASQIKTLVSPLNVEIQEDRMERMDERISRIIKRLVQIKVTKQLFDARSKLAKTIPATAADRELTVVYDRTGQRESVSGSHWSVDPIAYRRTRPKD